MTFFTSLTSLKQYCFNIGCIPMWLHPLCLMVNNIAWNHQQKHQNHHVQTHCIFFYNGFSFRFCFFLTIFLLPGYSICCTYIYPQHSPDVAKSSLHVYLGKFHPSFCWNHGWLMILHQDLRLLNVLQGFPPQDVAWPRWPRRWMDGWPYQISG